MPLSSKSRSKLTLIGPVNFRGHVRSLQCRYSVQMCAGHPWLHFKAGCFRRCSSWHRLIATFAAVYQANFSCWNCRIWYITGILRGLFYFSLLIQWYFYTHLLMHPCFCSFIHLLLWTCTLIELNMIKCCCCCVYLQQVSVQSLVLTM